MLELTTIISKKSIICGIKSKVSLYKVALSINRFQFFLRRIRFDNYRTRADHFHHDKLAPVSEIWEMFLPNLHRFYKPADSLTVDEKLLGYRGKIPGRTYLPPKPRKYGLQIFWICEADSGFALNAHVYTG